MENREQTKKVRGRPFQKGHSGNAGGRPKCAAELRDAARGYTVMALKTLSRIARHSASDSARVAAAVALLDRGWGKSATAPQARELPEVVEFKITPYQTERPPRESGEY